MKKAKLDILEDIPDIDIKPSVSELLPDRESTEVNEVGEKWAFNKLLIIAVPGVLIVMIVCGFLVYYMMNSISSRPETKRSISKIDRNISGHVYKKTANEKQTPLHVSTPGTSTTLYLKDFMIDIKDAGGNSHLLRFDVVFDLTREAGQKPSDDFSVLRDAIYKVAQSKSVIALRSVEERKKLKKDFASALEKILGDGSVKNVFFTNYLVM